jgi:hypothetical protein
MIQATDVKFGRNKFQAMVYELGELADDDQLSQWEKSFVENMIALIETDSPVTPAQEEKLQEIYGDYFEKGK